MRRACVGRDLGRAERAVAAAVLWNVRVLTGRLLARGTAVLRVLAASAWGQCGTDDPADLVDVLRVSAATRLAQLHTRPRGRG